MRVCGGCWQIHLWVADSTRGGRKGFTEDFRGHSENDTDQGQDPALQFHTVQCSVRDESLHGVLNSVTRSIPVAHLMSGTPPICVMLVPARCGSNRAALHMMCAARYSDTLNSSPRYCEALYKWDGTVQERRKVAVW